MFATADWLYTEDQFDNYFGSLDSSIPTLGVLVLLASLVLVVWRRIVVPLLLLTIRLLLAVLPKLLLVLLLLMRVLWNSDSPVISSRLVSNSPSSTGS
jgi:hypothetical protein